MDDILLDASRAERLGFDEAVYCAGKSPDQIARVLAVAGPRVLLTRLSEERFAALPEPVRADLDYDPASGTAWRGPSAPCVDKGVAVVAAGTSDHSVATEVERTLRYYGVAPTMVQDVGVSGLWRLQERVAELRPMRVVIVVAGMDAALPSVVGGLVRGAVIAVPTSVGYGVAQGGTTALNACLASCAPGVAVVNIDNGFGAAMAALRIVGVGTAELAAEDQARFMGEALAEGRKALPDCLPNPPVGCVLVRDGVIVARGHTQAPGQPHAEPMALAQLEGDLSDVVAFVTLEPCAFHQRTPSCAREMIRRGLRAAYLGVEDPHPRNSGAGVAMLRAAGMTVTTGVLAQEAERDLGPYLWREGDPVGLDG